MKAVHVVVVLMAILLALVGAHAQQAQTTTSLDAEATAQDGIPRWRTRRPEIELPDWCQQCSDDAPGGARGVTGRGHLGELPVLSHAARVPVEVYRWHGHGADVGALNFAALVSAVETATGLVLHATTPGATVDGSLSCGGRHTIWLSLYTANKQAESGVNASPLRGVSATGRVNAQSAFASAAETWAGRPGTAYVRPR